MLGLGLVERTPFALVFDARGTTLRLTIVDDLSPAPYTVLGWGVADLRHTVLELAERGVDFERFSALEQDDLAIWEAPGNARVAWFRDPDGNLLSITET